MANYVKFKQGLKKDFNTTNQPLTNGMIYFVIDENNNGSIYYDTIVDGKKATKNGTVHRVKFSGLPIKITGSVIGTGVISQDGETIEINTATNHSHGLAHQDFTVKLSNDDTNLKWTRLGNQNGGSFWLKSIRGQAKAPAWFLSDYSAGIAFGGEDTKGIISVRYSQPGVRFAGGDGDAPVWYFTITGSNDKSYDLNGIGGHSSDSAKLDHNVTFKIASTADATKGGNGTTTNLSGAAVDLYLPVSISGFNLLQATRFQGNADSATYATSAGYAKGLFLNPETHQEDMNFNLADAKYIKRVTYSMATSTTKKNKPPVGDANILSFGWDNSGYGSQLAIQNGSAGHLAVRGSSSDNGASSWGEWSTVLDSSNYTSYVNNYYWANIKVSTTSSTETKPTFNTAYTSNWWRSTGKTGWWNDTYSGGIAMEDKTYVKVAGNKSFLIPNGSLKIGGGGNIFFATGGDDATLKIYGQTNTEYGIETIAIQTCFDNKDPQISTYTTQYANRCNLLLQPRGGQVYIGKNLTAVGDTGYKLLVDGNAYFNGHIRAASTGSSWLDGQRYNYGGYNLLDATDSISYWPWLRQTNTNTKKWFSFGILSNSFYLIGSSTNRADDGYDFGWQFDISNGNTTFNTNGNKNSTSKTVINGRLIVNPYYSTEQSYSEGIRVNRANNGWANIILGGDNGSSTGTSSTTWLIGHRGSNGTNSGSGSANGANLAGKINDLTIEVNSFSGQGLTLPATQGELLTWQQRPIMAQLPAQGSSTTILNNANYKTAYLATTSNGNASMGLASINWYHVMNFRHLDNNGYNSQFVLPLSHNGQAAWRFSSGTTWSAWNYIFDNRHAMVPALNNAYNIGSISNYWATGFINNLYVAGNAHANGGNRIPTTGNNTGTIGSATVPVYSDNGVLKTITSYSGNAATATIASSANRLNTSAGGNTNPIYFTNGMPVRSTASVGSANQPVYLNNGVITACAGSQSGTEKQQSFNIYGFNGTAQWYYLGHLISNGDASEVIIDIYSGNGYNGTGNQNTHISIFIKDGWQSTRAAKESFGISYLVDHSDVNATSIKVKGMASADNTIDLYVYLPWGYSDGYYSIKGHYNTWTHKGTCSTTEPTSGEVQNCVFGAFRAGQVYGAVWNDYAEYRQTKKYVQPGYCVIETGKGDLIKSSERLQPGANIVSDTFGFAIGETEQTKTPLAVSGRVLAYPYEDRDSYQAGDPVCSGPNGTISKMTRKEVKEYPDRIIGTVSEIPNYEVWGTGNVKVDNRIWIKVK